ncbi:tubulin-specific chaperone cofactor E-like protein [Stomoxys calcitrans]|uniref:Ubiquitin-like domain-containing protein n=1 Tax=Stomoxys calcitrans TaxID=35570 RepID=A0A1I8PBM8_STOCA|nr:tubulin-specific chaperone cofactor E-like protein [Stomoxys calcitrans]
MPSLLEAIERKYFSDCDDDHDITIQGDKGKDADAAAGGGERLISIFIPKLPPLQCVPELLVLNDCDIDCAGDFESIKDKCRRVRELDLAQNKLQDWQEVFQIVEHMPRIEFLNLSKNNLSNPLSKLYAPPITNLRGIVLNGTYLNWESIDVLLENLPVLEELHLSLNDYKEVLIDTAELASDAEEKSDNCKCCDAKESSDARKYKKISPHKALRTLHFTGNPVEKWPEICRLGRIFPCMENLVLADCPIKAIEFPEKEDSNSSSEVCDVSEGDLPQKHFPNLLFLNLSYASINTWEDIDRLATFPKLKNLRVKNWPLWERLECTEHERRQLLIARLPNVAILNGGGVITPDEREDAERAFIRHYMDKPESERPQRYFELTAKHGKLDPLVNISLKPDKRVKIILTYGDKSESRLVDIYRTVADLKVKLEKIIPLTANKMRLYYLDQDYKDCGPEEMRYPNKLLYSYNIQAGDEIIVDEKK